MRVSGPVLPQAPARNRSGRCGTSSRGGSRRADDQERRVACLWKMTMLSNQNFKRTQEGGDKMSEITETMLAELETTVSSFDSCSDAYESMSSMGCGCSDQCTLGCSYNCMERCASTSR